jgi:hypothetical protein
MNKNGDYVPCRIHIQNEQQIQMKVEKNEWGYLHNGCLSYLHNSLIQQATNQHKTKHQEEWMVTRDLQATYNQISTDGDEYQEERMAKRDLQATYNQSNRLTPSINKNEW